MPILDTILGERRLNPPLLYAISDRLKFPDVPTLDYLQALFETPAQIIQWREKDLSSGENRGFVAAGSQLSSRSGKLFLVNTEIELALLEGSDGAHLTSQQDLVAAVQERERSNSTPFILGKSVHSLPEVMRAEQQRADYVLLAPIFDPLSKTSHTRALGMQALREAVNSVSIPIFALGGITEENLDQVSDLGAYGIAGISWVYPYLERILKEQYLITEE